MKLKGNIDVLFQKQLQELSSRGEGTIGDMFDLEYVSCDGSKGEFVMQAVTKPWMRNLSGTLHGGMAATLLDQAMGCVAFCANPDHGTVATVQLQVTYHRPIRTEEKLTVKVRLITVTKSLRHFYSEVYQQSEPDQVCLTSTATFFYKPGASDGSQEK